jgi:hypothetical protein
MFLKQPGKPATDRKVDPPRYQCDISVAKSYSDAEVSVQGVADGPSPLEGKE